MAVNRRHFLSGLAAAGAVAGFSSQQTIAGTSKKTPLIVDGLDVSVLDENFIKMLRKGGVHCVHKSMGDALHYGKMYHFIEQHSEDLVLAKTVADIHQAKKDGKIAIVSGTQGGGQLIGEALIKAGKYSAITETLEAYHGLGLRILMLAYNTNNIFGGGNLNPSSPLTRAGRVLVEEMHKLKIIVDVGGHVGEKTSLDAIAMSSGIPVICSHTNMAGINPNLRATSDRVCEGIARTGGVIGITSISDFHTRSIKNYKQHGTQSPQATLDQHLDQYDYLKKLVGIDHVGLGPDFVCGSEEAFTNLLQNLDDSLNFPPEMLSEGSIKLVDGYKDISEVGNVIKGLKNRGWSQKELSKLLGGNWLRVYKQVWGA
ncbi:dipeptidase [Porticoccaceae bacterium]|nr:dipeptidase [Porticoccaceae bacterium]